MLDLSRAEFVRSAASAAQFPRDGFPQVAFAGRSNSGKSSAINCLLRRAGLARSSQTPGKTAHVNLYLVGGNTYFADLPGYGFARVSESEKRRWSELMDAYFDGSSPIAASVLMVDIRHEPTEEDLMMRDCLLSLDAGLIVLAGKADKIKKSEEAALLERIRKKMRLPGWADLIAFSAKTGQGREKAVASILSHLEEKA